MGVVDVRRGLDDEIGKPQRGANLHRSWLRDPGSVLAGLVNFYGGQIGAVVTGNYRNSRMAFMIHGFDSTGV